jgi:transposase
MAKIKLTPKQLAELINAEKQIKQPHLLKRIQCIKLRNVGMNNLEIANFLLINDQTVSNWSQVYLKDGLQKLLEWNYKGRVSIITLEQQQELIERNKKQPFQKASEAKEYIKNHFGHNFHLHSIQKLLKKNFSFHSKKQD